MINADSFYRAVDNIKTEFDGHVFEGNTISDKWIKNYAKHLCVKYKVDESDIHPESQLWTIPVCNQLDTPSVVDTLIENLTDLIKFLKIYEVDPINVNKMAPITEFQTIALTNKCSYLIRKTLVYKELLLADFQYDKLREIRKSLFAFKNEDVYSGQYSDSQQADIYRTKMKREHFPVDDFSYLRDEHNTQYICNVAEDLNSNYSACVQVRQESFVIMQALLEHLIPRSSAIIAPMEDAKRAERVFMIEAFRYYKFNVVDIKKQVSYLLKENTVQLEYTLNDWIQFYQQQCKLFREDTLGAKFVEHESRGQEHWFYLDLFYNGYSRSQYKRFFELKLRLDIIKNQIKLMQSSSQREVAAEEPQTTSRQADKEQAMLATNTVINTRFGSQNVDLLKLKKYIQEKFIPTATRRYHWMALFVFLQQSRLLAKSSYESFAMQMNTEEWFKDCKCRCSADSLGDYGLLKKRQPSSWLEIDIPDGSKMSAKGIKEIKHLHYKLSNGFEIESIFKEK